MRTKIVFHVDAGRFESDGEKNYKYCDQSETLAGATQMYEMALGYAFVEFYLVITFPNGAKRTVYLDGGDYVEERMRMSIANLWMQATGNDFFDLTEGPTWEEQVDTIEETLKPRTSWQDIHARFEAGQLTWTEAFDALMSQCGMPMEEALQCLTENFGRRPAAIATEV